jgi:hypothetical protein
MASIIFTILVAAIALIILLAVANDEMTAIFRFFIDALP